MSRTIQTDDDLGIFSFPKKYGQRKGAKRWSQERIVLVLIVLAGLISTQIFVRNDLLKSIEAISYSSTPEESIRGHDIKEKQQKETTDERQKDRYIAPIWSASTRQQQHKNLTEEELQKGTDNERQKDKDDAPVWSASTRQQRHKNVVEAEQKNETVNEQQKDRYDAPIWSAYTRQQRHKNVTDLDALLTWSYPGIKPRVKIRRGASEVLTDGIAGVLPWYGAILPAIRFRSPFDNTTKVEIVRLGNITDIFLDLQQCIVGRDGGESKPDGYYDVCFPHFPGRVAAVDFCFIKDSLMRSSTRIRNFPAPGHERWSCSDNFVMEQLAAAQVLDYIIAHGDRFYKERTNNLFFSSNQRPIRFVSIDHDGNPCKFFSLNKIQRLGVTRMSLEYELPPELRKDFRRVVLTGSKDEFVQTFNATIDGQLDNLNRVIREYFNSKPCNEIEQPGDIAGVIWKRLKSVAHFYNFTMDD